MNMKICVVILSLCTVVAADTAREFIISPKWQRDLIVQHANVEKHMAKAQKLEAVFVQTKRNIAQALCPDEQPERAWSCIRWVDPTTFARIRIQPDCTCKNTILTTQQSDDGIFSSRPRVRGDGRIPTRRPDKPSDAEMESALEDLSTTLPSLGTPGKPGPDDYVVSPLLGWYAPKRKSMDMWDEPPRAPLCWKAPRGFNCLHQHRKKMEN